MNPGPANKSSPEQQREREAPPADRPEGRPPVAADIREVDTTEYDESNAGEGPD